MSKEVEFKKVVIEFSFWEAQIKNLSSLNLLDGNIFSEDTVCTLLNIIFGYQLKNVNEQNNNYPAIDLADNYNRTAVQVTSTKTKKKIQSTLDKFFEHELQQEFDEIFIFILGKKQKSYTNLKIVRDFEFDAKKNILDFKDLLDIIRYLPKKKIEYIANFLQKERLTDSNRKTKSNAVKIKQNLALKKRLKKDLLLKLEKSSLRKAMYVPYIKFKYSKVIIRSVNDEKFPERGFTDGEIDSWFVSEFWRFYDNGLELVSLGGTVIFDENGNWDMVIPSQRGESAHDFSCNCLIHIT